MVQADPDGLLSCGPTRTNLSRTATANTRSHDPNSGVYGPAHEIRNVFYDTMCASLGSVRSVVVAPYVVQSDERDSHGSLSAC